MRWYGEKMLPKGLHELVYQVTPLEISEDLKIICYNKKRERGTSGQVSDNGNYFIIELFPTVIIRRSASAYGTQSFLYWLEFLKVTLHEIGHIITEPMIPKVCWQSYHHNYENRQYIEDFADNWKDQMIEKIASRDNRLGQPLGWIGGLPGIHILQKSKANREYVKKYGDNTFGKADNLRVKDIRALKCGGQHGIDDITKVVWAYSPYKRKIHRIIKRVTSSMGIRRAYIDSAGRKHLFFNHGEALAVAAEVKKLPSIRKWKEEEQRKAERTESMIIRERLESQGQMKLPF